MGKTIDKIVVSSIAPKNTNVLWDDGENLKIFRNGKWETTTSNSDNITEELKDAGIEYYDAFIKTRHSVLDYITQGFTQPIMNNTPDGDLLIEQLNKAYKSLNIYLIIDGTPLPCMGRSYNGFYFGYNTVGTSFDTAQIYYFYYTDETGWIAMFEEY